MPLDMLIQIIQTSLTGLAILAGIVIVVRAFRAGVFSRIRFGNLEILASTQEQDQARALVNAVARPPEKQDIPFETEQLAQYYAQVLAQSRISFWFSITFASLGFVVIIAAVFLYKNAISGATVAQVIAGIVMEPVSALFFVQSKRAQESMGYFFSELRKDRLQVESRHLAENISSPAAKDALRVQLALRYSGVSNPEEISGPIIELLGKKDSGRGRNKSR